MEVAITRRISVEAIDILRQSGCTLAYHDSNEAPSREKLFSLLANANALFCVLEDVIDAELISASPNLRVIATLSVGYNHIDLNACKERGIKVGNTPGVLTDATADIACILILSACRRIPEAITAVKEGQWSSWKPLWMCGKNVADTTLGIVGMGRIGQATARRMKAFGCDILYAGPTRKLEAEKELGASHVDLDTLLREADIVSLHCPLLPETQGLIGRRELDLMGEQSILVNTARGTVVKQDEMYEALKEKRILFAALDVTTPEPLDPSHDLLKLDNVLILPHIGSATYSTRYKMMRMSSENIVAGLKGDPLPFEVGL